MKTKFFMMMALATFLVAGVACTEKDEDPVPLVNSDPDGSILVSVRKENKGKTIVRLPEVGDFYIDEGVNFVSNNSNLEICSVGAVGGLNNVSKVPNKGWASMVAVQEGQGYFVRNQNDGYARLYVEKYILSANNAILGAYVKYQSPYISSAGTSSYFPDERFRAYLIKNFDMDFNGILSQSEINSIQEIYCPSMGITSLQGIELFTNMTRLYCDDNQLTSLDISKNRSLEIFSCTGNPGNGSIFPITAWFDNSNVPELFSKGSYTYNGRTVSIVYNKKN